MVPTMSPAFVIAVVAAACDWPTTFGTVTSGGPLETTRSTALPVTPCAPPAGDCMLTDPLGTVVLDAIVIVPTIKLALVIAVVAAACAWPTTFGTVTCGGPLDTTRSIALPLATCVPAAGDSLITAPLGTVVLEAVVIVPTTNPAPVMADVAAAWV